MKCNQQAQAILDDANRQANAITSSAMSYTDEMLANLENILRNTIQDSGAKYKAMMDSLQGAYTTVRSNRQEIAPAQAMAPETEYSEETEEDE